MDVATAGLPESTTVDPLTGLVTRDYLLPRVREVYAEAAARGIHPGDERCLLVVEQPAGAPNGWQRVLRDGLVGRVLRAVLDRGQTNTVLPSGTFLSLEYCNDALEENVVRVRRALSAHSEAGATHPSVRVERLPATIHEAERLLRAL